MDSLTELLVDEPLEYKLELLPAKLRPTLLKLLALRMDALNPNCELLGDTPGAYIYPVYVIVYSKISFQSILLL